MLGNQPISMQLGKILRINLAGKSCGTGWRGKSQFKKGSDWWKFSIWNRVMGANQSGSSLEKSCQKILQQMLREILWEILWEIMWEIWWEILWKILAGKSCWKICGKSCGKCCGKSCGKFCGKSCRKFNGKSCGKILKDRFGTNFEANFENVQVI